MDRRVRARGSGRCAGCCRSCCCSAAGTSSGASRRPGACTLLGLAIAYVGILGRRPGPRGTHSRRAAGGPLPAERPGAAPDRPGGADRAHRDGGRRGDARLQRPTRAAHRAFRRVPGLVARSRARPPWTRTSSGPGSRSARASRRRRAKNGASGTNGNGVNGGARPVVEPAPSGTILDQPAARTSAAPMSQTVVTAEGAARSRRVAPPRRGRGGDRGGADGARRPPGDRLGPAGRRRCSRSGRSDGPAPQLDHTANIRRIEEKLLSFAIPAKVVATNSGPVVTQYEVRPEHHVKVSRIEALADDLAMALAARSIRIEAPIPGKDVVGIEIPNEVSEVVGFRAIVEERNLHVGRRARSPSRSVATSRAAVRRRPRQDAPPARGRRDRLGQERVRQRAHHEHPHARPSRRGPA